MENDMRVMKFEILVDKIRECVSWGSPISTVEQIGEVTHGLMMNYLNMFSMAIPMAPPLSRGSDCSLEKYLAAIYDYDSLNNYGKIIMKQSGEQELEAYKKIQQKVEIIKQIPKRGSGLMEEEHSDRFQVVFWAMMILTVDDTDKEERLSLVCDLARMLEITDEEVMDILHVIEVIYHKNEEGVKFHSEYTKHVFSNLMAAWNVPILDSHLSKDTEE